MSGRGYRSTDADRHLERELAEGAPREGRRGGSSAAQPDVLLMQETKLADADVPRDAFRRLGYELAHHGEGRWNGVAIASRGGIDGRGHELRRLPVRDSAPAQPRRREDDSSRSPRRA